MALETHLGKLFVTPTKSFVIKCLVARRSQSRSIPKSSSSDEEQANRDKPKKRRLRKRTASLSRDNGNNYKSQNGCETKKFRGCSQDFD